MNAPAAGQLLFRLCVRLAGASATVASAAFAVFWAGNAGGLSERALSIALGWSFRAAIAGVTFAVACGIPAIILMVARHKPGSTADALAALLALIVSAPLAVVALAIEVFAGGMGIG